MFDLPLFPLNTVLFPGAPLHLHIFEERYKTMINLCLKERQPFGVVLIRRGLEAMGPLAEPYPVGCTALIFRLERLEQGRMNLFALGQERFRILSLDRQAKPYLVGQVELFPLVNPAPQETRRLAEALRLKVERFLQPLVSAGNTQFDFSKIPEDPQALAYTAASLLQNSPSEKQELLALPRADELLVSLQSIYRREIALLKEMLALPEGGGIGSFSKN